MYEGGNNNEELVKASQELYIAYCWIGGRKWIHDSCW
jgi:hypothetical protein